MGHGAGYGTRQIAPCRHAVLVVGSHRRSDKITGCAWRFCGGFRPCLSAHKAYHAESEADAGRMAKQVKGAGVVKPRAVALSAWPPGSGWRKAPHTKSFEQGRLGVLHPQGHILVHLTHTKRSITVFFDGLQTVLASHHQLTQGQQKSAFMERFRHRPGQVECP